MFENETTAQGAVGTGNRSDVPGHLVNQTTFPAEAVTSAGHDLLTVDLSTGTTLALTPLSAPLPYYSIDQVGEYLRGGFWDWMLGGIRFSYNMGASGVGANHGVLYYDYDGYSGTVMGVADADGLTAARRALVDHTLDYIGHVLGIEFRNATLHAPPDGQVDLYFTDADGGAYATGLIYASGDGTPGHRYVYSFLVNVDPGWAGGSSAVNSYTYQTFIHEIGHALGLGHAGPYNGYGHYVTDTAHPQYGNNSNIYLNDSWQMSIMSYFSQTTNTVVTASYAHVISWMAGDYQALRHYYGASHAFNGDTVYGFNTNIPASLSQVWRDLALYADKTAFTLIDSSGIDTVDLSGYSAHQRIDLTVPEAGSVMGSVSNIGGLIGNMTIAVGTVIENAIAGPGNDTLIGNTADNGLYGGAGSDSLLGAEGNDTLDGGAGADTMLGGEGNDLYFVDHAGDAVIDSGGERDGVYAALDYTLPADIEDLWLMEPSALNGTGNALANRITGNAGNNLLSGLGGNDTLYGMAGDDTLNGGGGADLMYGGPGNDTYVVSQTGDRIIELENEGTDIVQTTLTAYTLPEHVENLDLKLASGLQNGTGNALNNVLRGGNANNTLYGLAGNDLLLGAGGDDTLDGGSGSDTLYGGVGSDWLFGGEDHDVLFGDDGDDWLFGGAGADTLNGGGYDDRLDGGEGHDSLSGGAGQDMLIGGGGHDTLNGGLGNDYLEGGDGDDSLMGAAGNDSLFGGADRDSLWGGEGSDWLSGGDGHDWLYAGVDAHEDFFVFTDAIDALSNVDRLYQADFPEDQILLDNDIFTGLLSEAGTPLGTLAPLYFFKGAGYTGADVSDPVGIWYDLNSGALYYNPTVHVAGDSILFAMLYSSSPALGHADFTLID